MAHYPDLSLCQYLTDDPSSHCLAIGWLEPEHQYTQGDVSPEFFEKLCQLLVNPWTYVASGGVQHCGFCRFSGGGDATFKGYRISSTSNSFLFVPSGSVLYASPLSIAHYIDAHRYCPPAEYQEAVLQCPEMRSMAYMKALLVTPFTEWRRKWEKAHS